MFCSVSIAHSKGEWNDLAATCFIPADDQILTSDNLMHTIPFALRGTSFPKRTKQTSEKAKPSRKRQWAVFGRSGIAAEQNDCVVVACRSNEHAASVRLLAYTENPSGVLGFHVLSNHFFP